MEPDANSHAGEVLPCHEEPLPHSDWSTCLLCGVSKSAGNSEFVGVDSLLLYQSGADPISFLSSLLEIEECELESSSRLLCACCSHHVRRCSRLVHLTHVLQQRLCRLTRRLVGKWNKSGSRQIFNNDNAELPSSPTIESDTTVVRGNGDVSASNAPEKKCNLHRPPPPLQRMTNHICADHPGTGSPMDAVEAANEGSASGEHLDWNELLAPRSAYALSASTADSCLLRSLLTRTSASSGSLTAVAGDNTAGSGSGGLVGSVALSSEQRLAVSDSSAPVPGTGTSSISSADAESGSLTIGKDRRSPITVFQLPDGRLLMRCPTNSNKSNSKYTRLSQADINNLLAAGNRFRRKKRPRSDTSRSAASPGIVQEQEAESESASLSSTGSHANDSNILQSILQTDRVENHNDSQSSRTTWVYTSRQKGNMPSGTDTESCPLCALHFYSRTEVDKHLRDHSLACNWCGSKMESRMTLFSHRHRCSQRVEAVSTGVRDLHVTGSASTKSDDHFSCSLCPAAFCRINRLNEHAAAVHGRLFRCAQCRREDSDFRKYEEHLQVTHSVATPYPCNLCGFTFVRATLVARHFQLYHSAPFIGGASVGNCRKTRKVITCAKQNNSRPDTGVVYSTAVPSSSEERHLASPSPCLPSFSETANSNPFGDELNEHMVIVKQEFLSTLND